MAARFTRTTADAWAEWADLAEMAAFLALVALAAALQPTDYHGRPAECPQCHGLDGILQIGATRYVAGG